MSASCRPVLGRRPAIARSRVLLVRGRRRGVRGRHPVHASAAGGCWRALRRDLDVLCPGFAALPDEARVYSGHDYTLANARFALAADPDNAALKARAAEAEEAKAEGRFLVPPTIGDEKATNPFLRAGDPALAQSAGQGGADPAAVFQALREWKNRF